MYVSKQIMNYFWSKMFRLSQKMYYLYNAFCNNTPQYQTGEKSILKPEAHQEAHI